MSWFAKLFGDTVNGRGKFGLHPVPRVESFDYLAARRTIH
jgi:hypothetical protein